MMPESSRTPASSAILYAALEYADNGFSVIPVRRIDKRPYIKWEQFQKRPATREEIEDWWHRFPSANVAIVCGKISGIYCVDSDGPEGDAWIDKNLPRTGVYSIPSKGTHAIFRCPPNSVIRNKVRLAPEVDIRGDGGYFVAPPSIHASGHVYEWRFIMGGWDDLVEYAPPDPRSHGNLNLNLESAKDSPVMQPVSEGKRNHTLAQLAGRWVAKGLDYDEVLLLAKKWNDRNSPPMGWSEVERTVKSIFQTHVKNHPEIGNFSLPSMTPDASEIPSPILSPGGLLQDLMNYYAENSAVSYPLFNLAGALTLVGAISGQKVMTETGLRTNCYCVSVGYSGSGKNAPLTTTANLLAHTSAHSILGPNEATSHSSILIDLKKKPILLMLLDEIGHMITSLKNPMSPAAQVPRILNDLFTRCNAPYVKSYASHDEIVIPYHHLSIYGVSTPSRFWESLTFNDATDGFLARMLIFCSDRDADIPKPTITFNVPPSLIEQIDTLYSIKTSTAGGNLNGSTPVPHIIPKTGAAQEILAEWSAHYHQLGNLHKKSDDGSSSIYRRAAEHASKLALIHAISLRGTGILREQVDVESMLWAIAVMDFLIPNTIKQIQENIAFNELDEWRIKIRRIISMKATDDRPGCSKRELFQYIRGLDDLTFNRAMNGLIESGTLCKGTHKPTRGRECELYYFP